MQICQYCVKTRQRVWHLGTRWRESAYAVIRRMSQMTYGPKLSPRTGARRAWLGPTWWLGSVYRWQERRHYSERAELISHVKGICVESGTVWLHSPTTRLWPATSGARSKTDRSFQWWHYENLYLGLL